MSISKNTLSFRFLNKMIALPAMAILTLTLLHPMSFANEQRFTFFVPGGATPADWQFDLSMSGNPTAGGSATATFPTGTTPTGVATAAAKAITDQMGIKTTSSGNTIIMSQHEQDPGFFFNPLAPGTRMGTAFGGLAGNGGGRGPFGVRRAFRVWAPAPPPPAPAPAPVPPQRKFGLQLPLEPIGIPGVFNEIQISLLDDHDELLFSQNILLEDTAGQEQLDFALLEAFQQFPTGLGGWMMLPEPDGFSFGNSLNEWMTGGGIEVMMLPGSEQSQMQLGLVGEELLFPYESYADFNVDGSVDKLDMSILESYYGAAASFGDGDANFDNHVNGADFLEVQRLFGAIPQVEVVASRAVPEPNTLVLAFAGGLAMLWRRR